MKNKRIENFKKLKKGLFVHFGLYSQVGKAEWYLDDCCIPVDEYKELTNNFKVPINWCNDIIEVAKSFGAKYIVLTTRHHDGFSLYDTKGLSDFDVMHTPTKRDLIKEFVDACNKNNIEPFFYHTLIDWTDERFKNGIESYLKYLKESVELLCRNYGKIGGFWFDGSWYKEKINWNFDEIFSIIRKYQPNAIISNNGGLENVGEIVNKEIDCKLFERGNITKDVSKNNKKELASEMCQTINDHWGYYKGDRNYKSIEYLFNEYLECQKFSCNYLLNVGPRKNGKISKKEKNIFKELGIKIKKLV